MRNKRRKNFGMAYNISIILAVLIIISGVIALVLFLFHYKKNQIETIDALSHQIEIMYTEEDMQSMLAGAVEEATSSATQQTREEILGNLKARLSEGESTVSVLRPYYPDDIVVVSDGKYHFVPILDTLAKHGLSEENLFVNEETGEVTYQENGVVTSHKGIDVSKYQGDIQWNKVKADGVEYAFIRLGFRGYESGKLVLDEYFIDNIEGALAAGVEVGVYFFSQAVTEEEAIEEAEYVLENLEPYDITYPIVFDVEKVSSSNSRMNQITKEERTNVTLAFCQRIEEAGMTPMIYGNMEMFSVLIDLEPLEKYEKWFAYYAPILYYPYDFKIWQYTESGIVDGIDGGVDMNISFKTW